MTGPTMTGPTMTNSTAPRLELAASNTTYLNELSDFVAIPSISRDAGRDTMQAAAQWHYGPGPLDSRVA